LPPEFDPKNYVNKYADNYATDFTAPDKTSENTCEAVLDRFDRFFDEKRLARQKRVRESNATSTGKYFFDKYEPEANCFTEERFGFEFDWLHRRQRFEAKNFYDQGFRYDSFGDGPKFICGLDLIRNSNSMSDDKKCLVYSVGSANKIGFEMAVHKLLGCETHTFDPTINTFVGNEYATFHQWGLGVDGEKINGWESKSFETVIQALGHENRTIDILKIDCEGCEWATMPPLFDAIASGKTKVNQIQIELHSLTRSNNKETETPTETREIFFNKMDQAGMRIFHKERNQWGCDGWKCVEYSFVSEEFLRIANKEAVCGS